ncbi:universal stress protein [Streptomyces silvensis]|uniref:UspA domain-containing protein n=1 Tax=Streptomyces silvensis TaxID=1765722 RepID=A0A0W7X5Z2_9ACTN|nr:universal stress protein [Streptomyces silvensis]KUF18212.1 hypothetical protein AT728_24870 [Streptomyces silvensis]
MDATLIVGVDGSEPGMRALDWAADEAARAALPLRIVHASGWEWYEGHEPSFGINREAVRAQADRVLAAAVDRARGRAAGVTGQVVDEDPAAALVRESHGAAGVVVGSRGRGPLAGLLLGTVSRSVAARAASPVTVVRGGERSLRSGFRRVVVGVDETAAAAVEFAVRAARLRGAELRAVRAWHRPPPGSGAPPTAPGADDPRRRRAADELEAALRTAVRDHGAVTVCGEPVEGQARAALLEASATADLLVVGARRRPGRAGPRLGPVGHAVLHHSACPVTVVPHA